MWEASGNKQRISGTLTNLGVLHYYLNQYDEALEFYREALALNEELGRKDGIANVLGNIGVILGAQGKFEEALEAHERSLSLERELGDREGVAIALNNIGEVYFDMERFEEALGYYRESLDLKYEIGNPEGIANGLLNLSETYSELNDEPNAFLNAQEALTLSLETENLALLRDSYERLSAHYETVGQFDKALESFKNYKTVVDSLFNSDSQSIISELQTQYRTREQEQAIALLERDRAIQNLRLTAALAGLVLFLAVVILVFFLYRLKTRSHNRLNDAFEELKSTQQQLIHQEKMASLGQLTAGIAHEIKNPLNFVNNFARLSAELVGELRSTLADRGDVEDILDDLEKNAEQIARHGDRADRVVVSMMKHASDREDQRSEVHVNTLVDEFVTLSSYSMRSRQQQLEVSIKKSLSAEVGILKVAPKGLSRVLQNVLSNAFEAVYDRFCSDNASYKPEIQVSTYKRNDRVIIEVTDNGPGIPEDIRERIFEPFFTTRPTGSGTGLGLSLSYDIIKVYGGQIEVESTVGEGATFTISLPAS